MLYIINTKTLQLCKVFFITNKLDRVSVPNSYSIEMSKHDTNIPNRLRHYDNDGDMDMDIDFNDHKKPHKHQFKYNGAHKHYYLYKIINGNKVLYNHTEGEELTYDEYVKYIINHQKLNPTII